MRGRHDGIQKSKNLIVYVCLAILALSLVFVFYGSFFNSTSESTNSERVKQRSVRRSVKDIDVDEEGNDGGSVEEETNIRLKNENRKSGAEENDFDVSLKSFPVSDFNVKLKSFRVNELNVFQDQYKHMRNCPL